MRLRAVVSGRPKSMCMFNRRPFLSILMAYTASFGFKRFILCTGYMGRYIKKYYSKHPQPWNIAYSHEQEALGTGGALKKAGHLIRSNSFLLMNGDSFCAVNLDDFLCFHSAKKALLTIALTAGQDNKNSGKVILNRLQRIIRFQEKARVCRRSLDSAGIYCLNKDIFSYLKGKNKFSLEYDLFPLLVNQRSYGFLQAAQLVDFGTPYGYLKAQRLFSGDSG